MKTNTFFTIFWMIYFPVCIAFYQMIGMDYSDELLTVIMIMFAVTKGVFSLRKNRKIVKEVRTYILLMVFYVIYSLIMAVNVRNAVFLDLQQQVRPYAVLYCTWLLNPQFTEKQKKLILTMMVTCTVMYAVMWRGGIRGLDYEGESAVIGQLSLVSGIAWYLWKPMTKKNRWIALGICAIGLLGGKSKFIGEMVAFVALLFFLKGRIKLKSAKTIMQFAALTAVIIFLTWAKFSIYYVVGWDENDEYEQLARPETYKTSTTIIFHDFIPFGSGLGTFATNAAAVYYSPLYYYYQMDDIWGLNPENPMFVADAFYPTLAEYGIFGVFIFLVFWKRRLKMVLKIPDTRYYKMGLMCILALALESTADTSYLSGKGMGYFMLLAICLNEARVKRKKVMIGSSVRYTTKYEEYSYKPEAVAASAKEEVWEEMRTYSTPSAKVIDDTNYEKFIRKAIAQKKKILLYVKIIIALMLMILAIGSYTFQAEIRKKAQQQTEVKESHTNATNLKELSLLEENAKKLDNSVRHNSLN